MINRELPDVRMLLSGFPCSGLSIEKIKHVLNLYNKVKSHNESYEEIRKKIFESYGIKTEEDLANSKDIEKVTKEITDLDSDVAIEDSPILTEDEVLKSAEQMRNVTLTGINLLIRILAGK